MSAARHLRVIDTNGEVIANDDPYEQIQALEAALVRAERVINGLRNDKAAARKNYARRGEVEDIFEDWRRLTGHPRSRLTDDRFDGIKDYMEKGYTAADFALVTAALGAYPFERYGKRYAEGAKEERKDDIGWVCEKARRFEQLANLGHALSRAPVGT